MKWFNDTSRPEGNSPLGLFAAAYDTRQAVARPRIRVSNRIHGLGWAASETQTFSDKPTLALTRVEFDNGISGSFSTAYLKAAVA